MGTLGSNADIGHGTTISWSGDTINFTTLKIGDSEVDVVETTHSATTSKWKTFIAGLKDAGSITFTLNFAVTEAPSLVEGETGSLVVNLVGGSFTATAILRKRGVDVPIDGRMTASVEFKLSGVPVWA